MPPPRSGPCSPWVTGEQVLALSQVGAAAQKATQAARLTSQGVDAACAQAAAAASHVLYELSGRVYTGECGPETIRPVARPTDSDTRSLSGLSPLGWFSASGTASSYGSSLPGVVAHYATSEPPTIKLPWPVNTIAQVKIDGVIIPAGEYELRGHQELVRMRVNASAPPTQRWGWPTSQIMDLPDTEAGTFSITFTFGAPPPGSGILAATKLAEVMAMVLLGDTNRYPKRVTQIARQGVTAQVTSAVDMLKDGATGIWEVDLFILAVNPAKLQRQSTVWSPDVGRPRRQQSPSPGF